MEIALRFNGGFAIQNRMSPEGTTERMPSFGAESIANPLTPVSLNFS
jgi:hypothetical protein